MYRYRLSDNVRRDCLVVCHDRLACLSEVLGHWKDHTRERNYLYVLHDGKDTSSDDTRNAMFIYTHTYTTTGYPQT